MTGMSTPTASGEGSKQRYLRRLMNYLSAEGLAKSYGVNQLFRGLSFGIEKGQKVALVARNGAGKSSLMRILTGQETPDEGIVVFNREVRLGYLSQDNNLNPSKSILDQVFSSDNAMTRAIRNYEEAVMKGADTGPAHDEMDRHGAWSYEAKARQILGSLDIHDLDRITGELSGGQQRRIALARVLIEEPDLVLLDEPTNHLDLDMIEWLEEYLGRSGMTLFMVTHDRYFLENITDEILELENGLLYRYKGNFSYYLEKKAEREALEASTREKELNLYKRELEWARKMPRARTTKSKSRMDSFSELRQRVSRRPEEEELELEINIQRMGSKVVEFHKVKKAFGTHPILDGFDYVFKTGERVGLVGRNGSGKTTFLNLLTRAEQPDGGKVVVGDTVVFGYFSQSGIPLKEGQRLLESVREVADFIPLSRGKTITAAQMLERFMFPKHMHFNYVEKLSGGERKRLQLLHVLMKNPNFLILDEPTNDLDVFTLAALEEYLLQYPGCLLIVSHDRYFLDKLVDHLFVLEGGQVRDILGSYVDFRDLLKAGKREAPEKSKPPKPKAAEKQGRLSFKEKFELEQLEKEIPALEEKKKNLEFQLTASASDHETLMRASDELGLLVAELDEKSLRWLELSEKST